MKGLVKDGALPGIDPLALSRYDRPVPRYTSYPTALQFRVLEDRKSRSALLADLEDAEGPISLYIQIPYCRSLCWFCGCTRLATSNGALADRYLKCLEMEMALYAPLLRPGRKVRQLRLGGGSPNFLSVAQIRRLNILLKRHFEFERWR